MNSRTQIGIALDQLLNAFCRGWADETLSARAWRNHEKNLRWKGLYALFNAIFFWQNNHCRGAYAQEQERMHMPPEYRVK